MKDIFLTKSKINDYRGLKSKSSSGSTGFAGALNLAGKWGIFAVNGATSALRSSSSSNFSSARPGRTTFTVDVSKGSVSFSPGARKIQKVNRV